MVNLRGGDDAAGEGGAVTQMGMSGGKAQHIRKDSAAPVGALLWHLCPSAPLGHTGALSVPQAAGETWAPFLNGVVDASPEGRKKTKGRTYWHRVFKNSENFLLWSRNVWHLTHQIIA